MKFTVGNSCFSKVLIVEDDRAQLLTLTDIFTDAGFTPVTCPDLEALNRQLIDGQFGIAIVDLNLADVSGTDAINIIKQANSAARIIVYTAFGSYESAKEAVNLGVFAYVEKAGDIDELIGHVRRAANELLVEALQRSEQTFRNLAENIDAVFWIRSTEGRLIYISPKCEQIWGIDSVGLGSNPQVIIESIVEEDRPRVSQALQQLCSNTHPVNFDLDYRIRRLDGEIVWIRDRSFSIYDDEESLVRHAGLAEDITQARLNVERLRILERAIASADIGTIICNTRQKNAIIYCNAAFERLTGYTAAEMLGQNCRILQGSDRAQAGVKELRRAVAEGRETTVVVRNYRKDGTLFWNEVSISPVYDELSEITHFVGFQKDISSRVEMEQKLLESERSLSKAQTLAKTGSWEFDLRTGQLSGSAEMLRLLCISEPDLIPGFESFLENFVDPRDRQLIERAYFSALETGATVPVEFRFITAPNRELRYGRCEAEIVKDENGALQKIIGTLQDITEQKLAAEERARHMEELAHVGRLSTMGEMVAGIAHELNQPLYSIANFSEACTNTLLKSQDQKTDRILKWTAEISKQAGRAGQIIQRLGEFVRKNEPHRSTVDLSELILESVELLSFEARRHHIRVEFALHEPALLVSADQIQLQQVIVNLLRNAYEALLVNDPADRRVIVATLPLGNNAMVRIEDNGPGIPPAAIEQIFEPFLSTKEKGMGMGLAISKSILEAHDGTLTARSGKTGTIFEFTLAQLDGGGQP